MKELFRRVVYVIVIAVPMCFTLMKVTWRQSKNNKLPTLQSVSNELKNNSL